MFKRVTMLLLVFMLAFSPAVTFAAESTSSDDGEQVTRSADNNEESTENDEQTDEKADGEKAEDEKADDGEEEENADSDAKANADSVGDEESEDENGSATEEDEQDSGEEADDSSDAVEDKVDGDKDNDQEDSQVRDEEGSKIETQTADEDLILSEIHGTARGDIEYDFDKGYYVLHLRAGFYNWAHQDVVDKWVAFALPHGVEILDTGDMPSGMVPVTLADGHKGIAVKVPNIRDVGSEYSDVNVPLTGEPDDNDPNFSFYILNVDGNANTYENLGEIGSSNDDIDFSVMEETPELDMEGSVTGAAEYNKEDHVYDLNLNATLTNNIEQELSEKYIGFEIPEGVRVSDQAGDDVAPLDLGDGKKGLAVKFSSVEEGDNSQEVTIPVLGKTDGEVADTDLTLYQIDEQYNVIGTIDGSADIDYSAMDQTWQFNADAEIYNDYPDLPDNYFGFKLLFGVNNVTIDEDFDQVKVEFMAPDGEFTVHEPDNYIGSGNLDIDWDGNTATVDLDSISSASGIEGWFEGFAESSKSPEQLEGTEVKVTLFADGDQVKEVTVPFVLSSYDGDGGGLDDPGKEDPKPDPEDPKPKPEDPEDPENPGNDDDNGQGNGKNNNNDSDNGNGKNNNDNNDGTNGSTGVDNNNNNNGPSVDNASDTLPKTGTFFGAWFWQLLGALMLISGGLVVFRSRKARA